ncbi:MAG TPA: biopolymer transporter ExbD [Sphingomicrobium sp.]
MAMAIASTDRQPMAEMNTTPLIDVMLVLLIMFIITIPVATNSIEVDVGGNTSSVHVETVRNKVAVTSDDRVLWNGQAVDIGQLAALLKQTRALPIEPELQFEPQAQASYALAARITQVIKASGVTKFGFVGNDRYETFGKAE